MLVTVDVRCAGLDCSGSGAALYAVCIDAVDQRTVFGVPSRELVTAKLHLKTTTSSRVRLRRVANCASGKDGTSRTTDNEHGSFE